MNYFCNKAHTTQVYHKKRRSSLDLTLFAINLRVWRYKAKWNLCDQTIYKHEHARARALSLFLNHWMDTDSLNGPEWNQNFSNIKKSKILNSSSLEEGWNILDKIKANLKQEWIMGGIFCPSMRASSSRGTPNVWCWDSLRNLACSSDNNCIVNLIWPCFLKKLWYHRRHDQIWVCLNINVTMKNPLKLWVLFFWTTKISKYIISISLPLAVGSLLKV